MADLTKHSDGSQPAATKSLPPAPSKRYSDGYWIFVYYPKDDFLMMLFKGFKKGYWPYGTAIWEAAVGSLSDEGMKSMREKDWQSYFIDTALTKDWREAYTIASKHFNTIDTFAAMRQEQVTDLQPSDNKPSTGNSKAQS